MSALFASPSDSINNFEDYHFHKQTKSVNELFKFYKDQGDCPQS